MGMINMTEKSRVANDKHTARIGRLGQSVEALQTDLAAKAEHISWMEKHVRGLKDELEKNMSNEVAKRDGVQRLKLLEEAVASKDGELQSFQNQILLFAKRFD